MAQMYIADEKKGLKGSIVDLIENILKLNK